jgi:hypothetical protein
MADLVLDLSLLYLDWYRDSALLARADRSGSLWAKAGRAAAAGLALYLFVVPLPLFFLFEGDWRALADFRRAARGRGGRGQT